MRITKLYKEGDWELAELESKYNRIVYKIYHEPCETTIRWNERWDIKDSLTCRYCDTEIDKTAFNKLLAVYKLIK